MMINNIVILSRNRFLVFSLLAWAAFFAGLQPSAAAVNTWIASTSSGNWNSATNWSTGSVPGPTDSILLSGSAGKSPWTMSASTIEVADIAYNLTANDRRLRNDSTASDSFLALDGGGVNGGLLINLCTSRCFSFNATGAGATPHSLTVELKTSGTFSSSGSASDAVLGGAGLVINSPVTELGGSRALTLTGSGTITLTGSNSYTGGTTVNMTGGTVLMSGSGTGGTFNGTLGAASSALNVQNGTLDIGATVQKVGAVTISGGMIQSGTLSADSFAATGSGTATVNSTLAGNGGLTKTGNGRLTLAGFNTFTGPTNVTGGALVVSGNIASSSCSLSGGTLCGTGTVGAVVAQSSGGVSPGTDAGTGILSATSLDLQAGARLLIRLGGTNPGPGGYDRLSLSGTASLAGDLQVSFTGGFTPACATLNAGTGLLNFDGDKFFVLLDSGIDGAFANAGPATADLPGYGTMTFAGCEFAVSYSGNAAAKTFTGGNDVVLMVVPEPGASLMIALGGVLLGLPRLMGIRRLPRR